MTLAEQIKQILTAENITQAKLAKETGLNSGALSSYLKGDYAGNNELIEEALNQWLARRKAKIQRFVQAPDFIQTETAKQIFEAFEYAQVLGLLTTVYGMSGAGKTFAAKEFKRNKKNVWIVTASPSRSTLSEILYEIALEIGLNDAPKRKGSLSRLIVKKLENSQGLLIIDEADHLPYDALEELRIMQEELGIGFVLMGNDKVYTRMRGASHQAHEYARLYSRLAKPVSIQKCDKNDVIAIAKSWGLDAKDKQIMGILNEIAANGGGLRTLTQCLRLAAIYAKGEDILISKEHILVAKAELGGK